MGTIKKFRDQMKYRKAKKGEPTCKDCHHSFQQEAFMLGDAGSLGIKTFCAHTGFGNSRKYFINPGNVCNLIADL